jgi:hypothetical protein
MAELTDSRETVRRRTVAVWATPLVRAPVSLPPVRIDVA